MREDVKAKWKAFFVEEAGEDLDALLEDGWKRPDDVAAEMGITRDAADAALRRKEKAGKFTSRAAKVMLNNSLRTIRIYRPYAEN